MCTLLCTYSAHPLQLIHSCVRLSPGTEPFCGSTGEVSLIGERRFSRRSQTWCVSGDWRRCSVSIRKPIIGCSLSWCSLSIFSNFLKKRQTAMFTRRHVPSFRTRRAACSLLFKDSLSLSLRAPCWLNFEPAQAATTIRVFGSAACNRSKTHTQFTICSLLWTRE